MFLCWYLPCELPWGRFEVSFRVSSVIDVDWTSLTSVGVPLIISIHMVSHADIDPIEQPFTSVSTWGLLFLLGGSHTVTWLGEHSRPSFVFHASASLT